MAEIEEIGVAEDFGLAATPASSGDHWTYWNAMAPLRAQRPGYGASAFHVAPGQLCKRLRKSGGDPQDIGGSCANTMEPSVEAWTTGPLDRNAVRGMIFPKDYFDWCKRYVAEALRNKPGTPPTFLDASPKAKMLWALDVMSHVIYGNLSLNIAPSPTRHTHGVPTPVNLAFEEIQNAYMNYAKIAVPELMPGETVSAVSGFGSEFPFLFHTTGAASFDALFNIMPWIQGKSYDLGGGKLYYDKATKADDTPLAQAEIQWALMHQIIGRAPVPILTSVIPTLNMAATTSVKRIPTFGFGYKYIDGYLRAFASAAFSYEGAIRKHLSWWQKRNLPSSDPPSDTTPYPVTFTDFRTLWSGDLKKQSEGTKAKNKQEIASYQKKIEKIPYPPLQAMSKVYFKIAQALNKLIPSAVGASTPPYYAISNPFMRTLRDQNYRTFPDGLTETYGARLGIALANLQFASQIDFGFYAFPWTEDVAKATLERRAPLVPSLSTVTFTKNLPKNSVPPSAKDVCERFFQSWKASDARVGCLESKDKKRFVSICSDAVSGKMSQKDMGKKLEELVVDACKRNQPKKETPVSSPAKAIIGTSILGGLVYAIIRFRK